MLKQQNQEFEQSYNATLNNVSSNANLLEELTYLESLERCMFDLASDKAMNQLTIVRSESFC